MKINVEFVNLEETVEFADFIKGRTMPASQQAPAAGAVQNTAPASTAPPVTQAGPGAVTQQPFTGVQPSANQPAPTGGAPTAAAPSYTLDDLARAAQPILDAGRHAELQALLQNFGVASLPALPQEQYGAFATALRGMGAQI